MHTFHHSVQDLESITQVHRKYIDRCYEIMPWLEQYRRKSPEINKYLYNSGAVEVFHKIKELKDQNLDRLQIKQRLEEMGMGSREEGIEERKDEQGRAPGSLPPSVASAPHGADLLLSEVKTLYERMLVEKEKRLEQQEEITSAVRSQLLMLLPEGKTAEQVRVELEAKNLQEREIETLRQREQDRKEIAAQLQALEGRWGVGKSRRELIKRLGELKNEVL